MGFEPANPHKYWVFGDQIGFSKVGRKWANGQKIDHFYPNSTNFRPYPLSTSPKLLPKVGSQKQKRARNYLIGSPHIGQISPGSRYISVLYGRFIFLMIPSFPDSSILGDLQRNFPLTKNITKDFPNSRSEFNHFLIQLLPDMHHMLNGFFYCHSFTSNF